MTKSVRTPSGSWQQRYMDRFYGAHQGWVDGTSRFHRICQLAVPDGSDSTPLLLEIGSGPPNKTSDFLAGLGSLTGVDTDPIVEANPALRVACLVSDENLPFPDSSFDACFSNWVLEHVSNPIRHLSEVNRVLRPGGRYIARTPNRLHYVSATAALTPYRFHKFAANRLRALPSGTHDPWRTFYRLNTRRSLTKAANEVGLDVETITWFEPQPCYGMASRFLFLMFVGYERLVNLSGSFEGLRHTIFVVFHKRVQEA